MNETVQEMDVEARVIGEPNDDPKDLLRSAREMIPVGNTGVSPLNFAQQIDYAQTMAKARAAIPQHLQNNVGDCLAVIDISTRAGLSPYMVANKTYVQSGRLCFESQLYHAFAQASGLLKGDLHVEYEGEGDDLVCIVTGYLRADGKPRVHRSERLKDAHPGHSVKTKEGGDVKFVKGSQLWDRKPKVQLFYDTSRDWVRIYCPRATLGIYTPDEIEEYGPDMARDVTPTTVGLHNRLVGAPKSEEGHKAGHVESELDQVAAGVGKVIEAKPEPEQPETAQPVKKRGRPKKADTPTQETENPEPTAEQAPPAEQPVPEPQPAAKVEAPKNPLDAIKTPQAYKDHAMAWIEAGADVELMRAQWSRERPKRTDLGVMEDMLIAINGAYTAKIKSLQNPK